ncbi:MAG TPA: WSC domain-containing protein [Kofleriaceae bacterium]|nr:WSC domain-containing protein [Kofleriaceae bacterium]
MAAVSACAIETPGTDPADEMAGSANEMTGTTTEALSACGSIPKAPTCYRPPVCTSDGWVFNPAAAGTACSTTGGTGTCDGQDPPTCVLPAPPPPPAPPQPIASGTVPPVYRGCWSDSPNRSLPTMIGASGYTVESCAAAHGSHHYIGLQAYGQCFVGDAIGATQLPDATCYTPCTANSSEICGGGWANSVYEVGTATFQYAGCYSDSATRALPVELDTNGASTIEACIAAAAKAGYSYAGLQYYGQCFAGNSLGYSRLSESSCNTACTANGGEACGGSWANSVYQIIRPAAPAGVAGLPQGLTGGLAHVNHSCTVSLNAFVTVGKAVVGIATGCSTAASCVVAVATQAVNVYTTAQGGGFVSCGSPNVFRSGGVLATGATTPVQTLLLSGGQLTVQGAPGWLTQSDGDRGNSANFGFYHQELTTAGSGLTDGTLGDRLRLPRGAACGFHHTQNTPFIQPAGQQSTCMGHDPAASGPLGTGDCPVGWVAKNQFDMSSGDGSAACGNLANQAHCGYFAWCEYVDPHGYCDGDASCMANARTAGYAIGISSDAYPEGVESYGGATTANAPCPTGFSRTNFYDDGQPAGVGLSWCAPLPNLPQGLTAGLAYVGSFGQVIGAAAYEALTPSGNGDGFVLRSDGDVGMPSNTGFYHQELASGGLTEASTSASFKLFPGTACGFHHTLNDPGRTCMGYDPANNQCPGGWLPRKHFDMSSGSGYYVWCEYQDPNNLCTNPAAPPFPNITDCLSLARDSGYANTVTSNTDAAGFAAITNGTCIAGWTATPYFDSGRPSGSGLAFCLAP